MADRRCRPRTDLTKGKILDAVIAFVDEHGPEALSTCCLAAAAGEDAEGPATVPATYPHFAEAVATGAVLDFDRRYLSTLDLIVNDYVRMVD